MKLCAPPSFALLPGPDAVANHIGNIKLSAMPMNQNETYGGRFDKPEKYVSSFPLNQESERHSVMTTVHSGAHITKLLHRVREEVEAFVDSILTALGQYDFADGSEVRVLAREFVDGLITVLDWLDSRTEDLEDDCDDDVITEFSLGSTDDANQESGWARQEPLFSIDLEIDECVTGK